MSLINNFLITNLDLPIILFFSVANSARLVISLAILFSNPLQFYVAISIIFPTLVAPRVLREKHTFAEYLLRYGVILFCCKRLTFTSTLLFYIRPSADAFYLQHLYLIFGISIRPSIPVFNTQNLYLTPITFI